MTRTITDQPYVYDGDTLDHNAKGATIAAAEREAAGKTTAELFDAAEFEHYMATRYYSRTEGRQMQADRAMLRAVTFDRLAREARS